MIERYSPKSILYVETGPPGCSQPEPTVIGPFNCGHRDPQLRGIVDLMLDALNESAPGDWYHLVGIMPLVDPANLEADAIEALASTIVIRQIESLVHDGPPSVGVDWLGDE